MKRFLCVVIALCLLMGTASAQIVAAEETISGEILYPQDSTAETASFVFTYNLPVLQEDHAQYEAINTYFFDYEIYLTDTLFPSVIDSLDMLPVSGEPAYYIDLDYSITLDSEDYLSVLLVSQEFTGNSQIESWEAAVFAVSGIYAGQTINLSQAMGLEQDEDEQSDDFASELVYGLIWQIIDFEMSVMEKAYFFDLTEEEYRDAFTPQTDFYFDEDGNFVFFIQSGVIAGEVDGVLTYPFSLAELLSAV